MENLKYFDPRRRATWTGFSSMVGSVFLFGAALDLAALSLMEHRIRQSPRIPSI
jgi:hypothetical protein